MTETAPLTDKPVSPVEIPEFYSNVARAFVSAWDVLIEHGIRGPEGQVINPASLVRIRMSIEHAWVLAKLLDRLLAEHVRTVGRFSLPAELLSQLKLEDTYRKEVEGANERTDVGD